MKRILNIVNGWIGAMAGLLSVIATAAASTRTADTRPNIIVIVADDLGYADMAFLPDAPADVRRFGTPGFDRLAASGVYFRNAYASGPICSVARAALMTGRYQHRWGDYWFGQGRLPEGTATMPRVLHEAGYATAKLGKNHLDGWGDRELPTRHGFEQFLGFEKSTWDYIRLSQKDVDAYKAREGFEQFGFQLVGPLLKLDSLGAGREDAEYISYENGFTTRIFTDEACDYIRQKKGGRPFYLHVAYNAVHNPTYVVEESWAKKVGARYVPWDREASEWQYPYWEPNRESNKVFHQKWGNMGEIDREGRRCYLANLLALDAGVASILDTLEATGQRENTLVVFLSDNGGTINTYSNNAPLNGYKYTMAEGGIRIPMIVSMPGRFPEGVVNDRAIVSAMDVFPTAAELAGAKVPEDLDGMSLLPVLRGERDTQHAWLAWARDREKWAIRKGRWKLTHHAGWEHRNFRLNENGDVLPVDEPYRFPDDPQLFDLENDIGETTNLIAKHPQVAAELRTLYEAWDAQMPGPIGRNGKPRQPRK